MLLSIVRVNGNLTPGYHQYIVLPFLYLSSDDRWMAALWDTVTKGTAKVNTLITLLQVDIHSSRSCVFSYRDFYVLSFRTVGINWIVIVFPYLLSPTVSAPCTRCIGAQVARFARPFEARPTDPVRREVFRQLADSNSTVSASSGWVAPTATLVVSPPPLARGLEESASTGLPLPPKGKKREAL